MPDDDFAIKLKYSTSLTMYLYILLIAWVEYQLCSYAFSICSFVFIRFHKKNKMAIFMVHKEKVFHFTENKMLKFILTNWHSCAVYAEVQFSIILYILALHEVQVK
jgi:hypothetical protein